MALYSRIFNDINIIQAESQDALAQIQTARCTKCFKWWHYHWPHSMCMKSQGDYFEEDNIDKKVNFAVMEK